MVESHFTGEVDEHWLGSIYINMTVKDLDKVREENTKKEKKTFSTKNWVVSELMNILQWLFTDF